MSDPINPKHYDLENVECIDVMQEVFGTRWTRHYCLINALKYVWRCRHKDNSDKAGFSTQDIEKAIWYLRYCLYLSGVGKDPRQEKNNEKMG